MSFTGLSEFDPREAELWDPDGLLPEDARIFAVSYNDRGRMTALRWGTAGWEAVRFQRPLKQGDILFFLDGEGRPLREKLML